MNESIKRYFIISIKIIAVVLFCIFSGYIVKDILNKTLEDNDYINCFAGSLYFVSEIRKMFFDK